MRNNSKTLRLLGFTVITTLLSACGGTKTVKPDFAFDRDETNGLVYFSAKVNNQCHEDEKLEILFYPQNDKEDIHKWIFDPADKGKVKGFAKGWFKVELAHYGTYVLDRIQYGEKSFHNFKDTLLDFNEGAATYIGAMQIDVPACVEEEDKEYVPGTISVKVTDHAERDNDIFANHMINFSKKYLKKQILQVH